MAMLPTLRPRAASASSRLARWTASIKHPNPRMATYESPEELSSRSSEAEPWEANRSSRGSRIEGSDRLSEPSTLSKGAMRRLSNFQARLSINDRHGNRHLIRQRRSHQWQQCANMHGYCMGGEDVAVNLHVYHERSPSNTKHERLTINVDDVMEASVEIRTAPGGVGFTRRFEVTRRTTTDDDDESEIVHRAVSYSSDRTTFDGSEMMHSAGDPSAVRALIVEAANRAGMSHEGDLLNSLRGLRSNSSMEGTALFSTAVNSLTNLSEAANR